MITRYTHKELIWIDLSSPSIEEVREVMATYGLDPRVAEDLMTPSLKPKVDLYKNYIYLILHFPALHHSHGQDQNQEIDFVIGKNFLITTHYDSIDALHKFSKVFEVNAILEKESLGDHAGYIFFHMIKKLYKSLTHELDYVTDRLKVIENRIFMGNERQMVFELSKVAREILQFKQALSLHDEVLASLELAVRKFFGEDFNYYVQAILGAYSRVQSAIESNTDTLNELRATNDSLLSTKQNETMRVLALISFIMLPLSLIAGIFGMNTTVTPIVSDATGFYDILGIMVAVTIGMFAYFKHKHWL
jgi:magnesium transporter